MQYILEMKNVSKSFNGVTVLKGVNLQLKPGKVHALMGENGAGKSTLMKILIGIHTEFGGEIYYKGNLLKVKDVKHALEAGISMIHQELNYIKNMTVAENIFLGREPVTSKFLINKKKMIAQTNDLLDRLGLNINPRKNMRELSVSEQQMVEIAKAISYNSNIIIMDEPTSAITDREVEKLFEIIEELRKQGVAIIYISHKMDEIYRIADEITVLRDGEYIGSYNTSEIKMDELVSKMVGRKLENIFPSRTPRIGEEVISIQNLSKKHVFDNISFDVRQGEIVGLAGLMGAGRTEVMNCIYGIDQSDSGSIYIKGEKRKIRKPSDAIKNGIGFVSEDRKSIGLFLPLSVKDNITTFNLDLCTRFSIISKKLENEIANQVIKDFNVKTSSTKQLVKHLSGGNQQKIVIGKTLLKKTDVVILDEPTRGIDIGAKTEIYKLITDLANEGKAIILISSEMPEILGLSDRVIVLHEGKITGELTREEATQEKIMSLAVGKKVKKVGEKIGNKDKRENSQEVFQRSL